MSLLASHRVPSLFHSYEFIAVRSMLLDLFSLVPFSILTPFSVSSYFHNSPPHHHHLQIRLRHQTLQDAWRFLYCSMNLKVNDPIREHCDHQGSDSLLVRWDWEPLERDHGASKLGISDNGQLILAGWDFGPRSLSYHKSDPPPQKRQARNLPDAWNFHTSGPINRPSWEF